MTREEATEILKEKRFEINTRINGETQYSKALEIAIKALEQQSCEDAISRQAVLNLINADWKYEGLEEDVSILPPVTL